MFYVHIIVSLNDVTAIFNDLNFSITLQWAASFFKNIVGSVWAEKRYLQAAQ